MKLKRILVLITALVMCVSFLQAPALAAEPTAKTLTLTEDWRLTSDLNLEVPTGTDLTIDGQNRYYIYEMGGKLLNSSGGTVGTVYLKNTLIYAQGDDPGAGTLAALSRAARTLAVSAPARDATSLSWSPVGGYTADITYSSRSDVIKTDGTVTPPSGATTVQLVFTLTDAAGNRADSGRIFVTVPARSSSDSSDDSGGGTTAPTAPSVETGTSGNTTTIRDTVTGSAYSSGRVSGAVDGRTASALIDGAKNAERAGRKAVVEIGMETDKTAPAAEITIPRTSFGSLAADTNADLRVTTGLGVVTFDAAAVNTINAAASGDVKISVAKADTSTLSDEAKAQIGDRPVYDFTVTSGGKTISDFGGGSASVSIPYALKPGEDPNAVVVYYISDSGKLETVRGVYNESTGTVDFATSHFSKYAVGYNKVSFSDVAPTDWYYNAVTFIAARGITTGTTADTFSPDMTLTRGQFIVMLMRAYEIEADIDPIDNFSDAGGTYYTNYLAAAKRLGISNGVGGNLFAPETAVTRQEMFTLLYNALKVIGQLPQGDSGKTLSGFTDAGEVASWAKDAMTLLVETGAVGGSAGKLDPADRSARAQMAQVLYNLLGK